MTLFNTSLIKSTFIKLTSNKLVFVKSTRDGFAPDKSISNKFAFVKLIDFNFDIDKYNLHKLTLAKSQPKKSDNDKFARLKFEYKTDNLSM